MDLIRIEKKNGQDFVSSLKEIYLDAGMDKTHWSRWYVKNVEENLFFAEGQDYQALAIEANGNITKDFVCVLDMAKHLIMQMSTEKAFAYRQYLIDYENKTKLPGTYKEALLALVAAEEEKEQLLLANKQQQELIAHKVEVITGLTDEVDVFKKKDIINRIIKNSGNLYRERYNEIYFAFKNTYHVDLPVRSKSYNAKQTKKKDQLSVIGYAEKFGHIDQMYKICCKLYETEVNLLLKELGLLVNL